MVRTADPTDGFIRSNGPRVSRHFDIISGKNREWSADLMRALLRAMSFPYDAVTSLRNLAYDTGMLPVRSVDLPVLSIGNLTTGGTGKTPSVAWLVHWLQQAGHRPAILSRGFASLDGEENDEKRLLDDLCPGVPHVQTPRRIVGARQICQTTDADVIVLDDGFQHRKFHRDFDLVLIDALNPWGYGALLPRGLLRERISELRRADLVFVTRCELATDEQVQKIVQKIRKNTDAPVIRTEFQPQHFVNASGETLSLEKAAEQVGFAFCGIGNPEAFRRTLTTLAAGVPDERFFPFPDHYHYITGDLHRIRRRAEAQGAEILLTTRKDLVKIRQNRIGALPLWALHIGLNFLDDPQLLTGLLRTVFSERRDQARRPGAGEANAPS